MKCPRCQHENPAQANRTQGWLVLDSGSVSYGKATPYLPVIDLLKAYFKVQDREVREKVTGKLLTLDRSLETTLPALLDVPKPDPAWQALEPAERRHRTLEAVRRLLLRESQVQPLLVIFEDLHWIDGETQGLLDSLIESLPAARLLLLVNYRPEYQHARGSKTYYNQLRLDALPAESAGELLVALLGGDASLEPLKQMLIDRTGGNPFFLEESVRALAETKALVGERGAYRVARSLETLQAPTSVQAVLAARIDRLAPEDKRLLQSAAVRTFADQAVIAIENVRLFKELEARTQKLTRSVGELRALGEVGQAISSTLDLQTVLSTIVARATQLAGTDAGVIYEYDEQREVFVPRATERLEAEIVQTLIATPVRKGEGATGRLAELQEPIQLPDIFEAPAESRVRDALVRAGYRALLAVPLIREDRLIGGLTVIRRAPGEFAPEVIDLLELLPPSRASRFRTPACSGRSRRRAGSSRRPAGTSPSSCRTCPTSSGHR